MIPTASPTGGRSTPAPSRANATTEASRPSGWSASQPDGPSRCSRSSNPKTPTSCFKPCPTASAGPKSTEAERSTTARPTQWLNRFVGWVNDYCAAHNRIDGIPDIDCKPWHLKTSQFRRTLAWFIARRPGGAIAGALAFRHHAIQMFEGYAGTSESGFRAEVESEQALARGKQLVDLADTHQHTDITGPAADEAIRRLEHFALNADGFAGDVISDDHRLKRLMKRHDPAIYPGTYVTCVYRHDKALCRRDSEIAGPTTELADCKPLTSMPQLRVRCGCQPSRISMVMVVV